MDKLNQKLRNNAIDNLISCFCSFCQGVDECQTIKSDSSSSDDELLNPFLSGLLQDDIPGPSDACSSGTPTVSFY